MAKLNKPIGKQTYTTLFTQRIKESSKQRYAKEYYYSKLSNTKLQTNKTACTKSEDFAKTMRVKEVAQGKRHQVISASIILFVQT